MSIHEPEQHYIGLTELCQRLSLSPRTVRDWVYDPELRMPAILVRRKYLFSWCEIVSWLANHRVEPGSVDEIVNELLDEMRR